MKDHYQITPSDVLAEVEKLRAERNRCVEVMADQDGVIAELLEAAEQCLDDMGDTGHSVCEQAKQMLRIAVAKAKGGPDVL
jgi:hypothetical protein